MNLQQLKDILMNKWGALEKPQVFSDSPKLFEFIDFSTLDRDSKVFLCGLLMKTSSPVIGNFIGDPDAYWLVASITADVFTSTALGRRLSPLTTAFRILSQNFNEHSFDLYALLTPYLLAEIEYQVRIRSRYLNYRGIVQRKLPKHFNGPRIGGRVNQVHIAYQLLLYRNNTALGLSLKELDGRLGSYYVVSEDGKQMKLKNGMTGKFEKINSVTDRLKYTRNAIMHGEFPFISSEAFFYAFLLAIFFYCDPQHDA
jgi:hypothetical protein